MVLTKEQKWQSSIMGKIQTGMAILIVLMFLPILGKAGAEYGDGWQKTCYDDGRCAYSNHHTILRWDGQYIPVEWLNLWAGQWPYFLSENSTHYDAIRLGEILLLPKWFGNYTFDPNKISLEFTVTPAQLAARSTLQVIGGQNYWYIVIPDKAAKTQFLWDNKLPIISNESGAILNQSEYDANDTLKWQNYKYQVVGDEIRLYYNQTARNFGLISSLITFKFDSWIVGTGGNAWSGNVSMDNVTLDGDDHIILGNMLLFDDFEDGTINGSKWSTYLSPQEIGGELFLSNSARVWSISEFGNLTAIRFVAKLDRTNSGQGAGYFDWGTAHQIVFDMTSAFERYAKVYNGTWNYKTVTDGHNTYVKYEIYRISLNSVHFYMDGNHEGELISNIPSGPLENNFLAGPGGGGINITWTLVRNITTSGSFITWHDAGSGKETFKLDVNATTPIGSNYSVWYRQNGTESFSPLGSSYTGNNSILLSGSKYQITDIMIKMNGSNSVTPEISTITLWTQEAPLDCGTLDTDGTTYTLTQNVSSTGTCFVIGANNTTLDGQGYWVSVDSGAGVYIDAKYNNTIINLKVNGNTTASYGVAFDLNSNNNTIENCTVENTGSAIGMVENYNNIILNTTLKNNNIGIEVWGISGSHIISNNNIINNVKGIAFTDTSNNMMNNNTIQNNSYGVYIRYVSSQIFINGTIDSSSIYDYELLEASPYFENTNFTLPRKVFLEYGVGTESTFNYSENKIYFNTSTSSSVALSRKIDLINQSEIKWNDSATVTAYYNISGLLLNTDYKVYNNSVNSYNLTTDASGNLPEFSIDLNGDTEIQVIQFILDTSFTLSLPVGETQAFFNATNKSSKNVGANGQNETVGFLYITNTGNDNLDFYAWINASQPAGVVLKSNVSNISADATEINISMTKIISSLSITQSQYVWLWVDYSNALPMNEQRNLSVNSSQI